MSKEEKALTNLLESYSGGRESEANDWNGNKPRGYWQKWSNLKRELRVIIKQVEHFPSQNELGDIGLSGVARAINIHGGMNVVREKMGYRITKQAPGHWRDFNNIKSTLEGIIVQVGDFPSTTQLKDLGYSGLITGMQDYHKGIRNVKEKMGYENKTHPKGHWKKWSTVRIELEQLTEKLGHFPSKTELTDNGQGSVAAAIQQYHGGITKVKKRMGVAETRKPKRHWEQWRNVRKELKDAITTLGHFPTQKELLGLGKSSVCVAIGRHHGGINTVRTKMGYETEQKNSRILARF